jgi:hypothetical protein
MLSIFFEVAMIDGPAALRAVAFRMIAISSGIVDPIGRLCHEAPPPRVWFRL